MKTLKEAIEEYQHQKEVMISEMATIGWFRSGHNFKVFVNGSEGMIPHMHVWDDSTDGHQFHTCVRLDKPEYFIHKGKPDKFSSRQLKDFIEFLREEQDEVPNWKFILQSWNRSNPRSRQMSMLDPIPDYSKLK